MPAEGPHYPYWMVWPFYFFSSSLSFTLPVEKMVWPVFACVTLYPRMVVRQLA